MYNRLVAFGCSWTSGRAIFKPIQNDYPESAWSAHVANYLNIPVINNGKGGSSAKRIWKTILDFSFLPTDLVIILWTYKERSCVIGQKTIADLRPTRINSKSRAYYKHLFNNIDCQIDFNLRVDHANYFISKTGATSLNFSIDDTTNNFCGISILQTMKDVPALFGTHDDGHPTFEGHQEIAKRMISFI